MAPVASRPLRKRARLVHTLCEAVQPLRT